MANPLSINDLLQDSLGRTKRLAVPSMPYAGVFVLALGILVWTAGVLPDGSLGFLIFSALSTLTLFAHSLFSVSMYHAVLPKTQDLASSAWKLTLAWILVIVVAAIAASIIILFFALIGASLGVGASEPGQDITDMTEQMRESGTFWPLFAIFLATLFGLFWFAVRLMTFAAASSTRGAVHVFRTWYWTKGYFRVLAPTMLLLVVLPIAVQFYVASILSNLFFEAVAPAFKPAITAAWTMFALVPTAWLGHGFAASVFAKLAQDPEA